MAVKCPKCQTENPETSLFCSDCGTKLDSAKEFSLFQTETLETSVNELTTGSTFAGRYQIIEELGKGGMGRVYKVLDTHINEKVALKLLKPEIAADRKTIERFSNELKFARKIRHKNVCGMYDLGREAGGYFITMEYVSGEDLKSFIRRSRQLVVGTAILIAKQVCEGLAEAHRVGVIHRDLKPGNIMIDKEGNAKIMDFGIARSISVKGITGAGVMIGTPEYMSPEQVEGKEIDARSDIYSLGIILYEMLTGQVPFEGDTPFTIGVKQKSEIPKDPKSLNAQIPQDLSRLILKCLEKDKERRYPNADELKADLEKIEKGVPTAERPVPKRKTVTSKEITVTFRLRRVLVPALIFIAFVAIGIIGWRVLLKKAPAPPPSQKPSLAILPFEDLSPQKDQEYFCDGLADELINRLAKVQTLRVPGRTSVFSLKGKALDIREIGEKLQVANVLEGSVRRTGEKMRVTVQLIKVADGFPIWSEKYERDEKDLFSLQDEISLQIIDKLRIELLGEARNKVIKRYTDSTEAYDSYMRGLWLLNNKVTEEDFRRAILYFERAIEIDPEFSLAYVNLAGAHLNLAMWHFVSADNAIPKAKQALENALAIDPEVPEALAWSGAIKYRFEYDWTGGESDIKKALELNPNCEPAHTALADILVIKKGQIDKGIEEIGAALELNPLSIRRQGNLAFLSYQAGRFDDALKQCQKTLEVDPEYPFNLETLGLCYMQKSLFQDAIVAFQKAVAFSGNNTMYISYLAYAHAVLGNLEKAKEILRELDQLSEHVYVSKYYLAIIQAVMGDKDKAFELLELAYKERDGDLIFLKTDPKFDVLRSEPRYEMMLRKINLERQ